MMVLSEYIEKYKVNGGRCLVLGLAPSLNEYLSLNDHRLFEIGVNNIKSVYTPDAVLVCDPASSFKGKSMDYGETPFFTPHPEQWPQCSNIISYSFGGYNLLNFDLNLGRNMINTGHTSVYCALILASYLGYDKIGLLGVDITSPGHIYDTEDKKPHELSLILGKVNKEFSELYAALLQKGIKIYNLSDISAVTAFPKIKIKDFIDGKI